MSTKVVCGGLVMATLIAGCASSARPSRAGAEVESADRNPAVLVEAGKAFAETGDLVRSEQYFAAALARGADEREVVPLLLRVCIASKHYRLGVEYAEAFLARNPDETRLRFLTAALYVATGDAARARPELEQAARERAFDAELQFGVAVLFRDDLEDTVSADRYFREYLRIAPTGSHSKEARASLMERVQ